MCDQCQELMIQGVRCHETGCPNIRKEREAKEAQERADDAEWDAHWAECDADLDETNLQAFDRDMSDSEPFD